MSMPVDLDGPPRATETAVLKALAEPVRWRIVGLLAAEELCVCHLVEELDLPQPLVSHHLKVLRDVGLVSTERFRYWTYYRLEPAALAPLAARLGSLVAGAPPPADRRRPCC
jgi:ArsR family transcriptional regulator